jgi:hypothetical protein
MFLSYVLGAAVIRFKLPTSEFLDEAFTGAEAWRERNEDLADGPAGAGGPSLPRVDEPGATFDGYTLYTTDVGARATLLNMRGEEVHRWEAPFKKVWPRPPHVRRSTQSPKVYIFGCHLYPNGDLLAVYHGKGDTPYGYGLVKLDRDSRVIWAYAANAHHSVNVGEDGVIYVLTQELARQMPQGLEHLPTPALVDFVVMLSPEGKELRKVSLLEAFRDTPYAPLLPSADTRNRQDWDVLHANCVEVLPRRLAAAHPRFKAGQVLVSLREVDALAVLDMERGAVVWAARGPWRRQHDPHFLDNGRLLVFDNSGSARESRVLEYDPQTQGCPWSSSGGGGPSFRTAIQGRSQRLPNGNTLIVDSKDGNLLEVTHDRRLVWSWSCKAHVPFARRYAPEGLTFLKGAQRARP